MLIAREFVKTKKRDEIYHYASFISLSVPHCDAHLLMTSSLYVSTLTTCVCVTHSVNRSSAVCSHHKPTVVADKKQNVRVWRDQERF